MSNSSKFPFNISEMFLILLKETNIVLFRSERAAGVRELILSDMEDIPLCKCFGHLVVTLDRLESVEGSLDVSFSKRVISWETSSSKLSKVLSLSHLYLRLNR